MMLSIGPIVFGLILGLIVGSQIKLQFSDNKFPFSAIIVILIVGFVFAWQYDNYQFYTDFPISTAFLSALIGIIVSSLIAGRK